MMCSVSGDKGILTRPRPRIPEVFDAAHKGASVVYANGPQALTRRENSTFILLG